MTVRRIAALALVFALGAPVLAAAQPRQPRYGPPPPADRGFVLSARLGYGIPGGDISDDLDDAGFPIDPALDDLVDWKIPLWFELGYRFNPRVHGGIFLEVAAAGVNDDFCAIGDDCDGSNVRFGLDLQYHFSPRQPVDPWIGFGFAVEFLNAEATDTTGVTTEFTYAALEFPLLEGGLDIALSPRFSLGPYVAISLGYYTSVTTDLGGGSERRDPIDEKALHTWIQGGVKASLKL